MSSIRKNMSKTPFLKFSWIQLLLWNYCLMIYNVFPSAGIFSTVCHSTTPEVNGIFFFFETQPKHEEVVAWVP